MLSGHPATREMGLEVTSLESGHVGWSIYAKAIRLPAKVEQLIWFMRHESDESIATWAALKCLEESLRSFREKLVTALPVGDSQDFARLRMMDLSVLDELVSRPDEPVDPTLMENWSQWLQWRAAKCSTSRQVLAYLSSSEATKRIRREALA
ncbi:hypothetical protein F9C11_18830 [Amycolatopsis sp. VS8301801F10]|uniref:hypothetical protein n=1 Tax=Amycolatopsis sp. VS8301801F10 TaxID=2652442 RepID=UPI0038FC3C8D